MPLEFYNDGGTVQREMWEVKSLTEISTPPCTISLSEPQSLLRLFHRRQFDILKTFEREEVLFLKQNFS